MQDQIKEIFDSVKGGFVSIAFAGALSAQSFWPASSILQTITSVLIGTTISCTTSPLISLFLIHNFQFLQDAQDIVHGALYFWIGLLGMQFVPTIRDALKKRLGSND